MCAGYAVGAGGAGGSANPGTSFPVAVTPATSYPITVAAGGFVTVTWDINNQL